MQLLRVRLLPIPIAVAPIAPVAPIATTATAAAAASAAAASGTRRYLSGRVQEAHEGHQLRRAAPLAASRAWMCELPAPAVPLLARGAHVLPPKLGSGTRRELPPGCRTRCELCVGPSQTRGKNSAARQSESKMYSRRVPPRRANAESKRWGGASTSTATAKHAGDNSSGAGTTSDGRGRCECVARNRTTAAHCERVLTA
mmetsp:Transcript_37054/g.86553  ORF Transcript_37054/g.86553 Transcript_37054/m.86553 type:complete len:200 (+) Transcript_37054:1060-1659(+)